MDTLIVVFLIIGTVIRFMGKKNRKQFQKAAKVPVKKFEEFFRAMESENAFTPTPVQSFESAVKPAPTASAQPVRAAGSMEGMSTAQPFVSQLGSGSSEGHSRYGSAPAGSMEQHSMEGFDYCDPSLGHDDHSVGCVVHDAMEPLDNMEQPAMRLSWNRESLVEAVVMSEILTRPSRRVYGRR